jgi:hypothetical protein
MAWLLLIGSAATRSNSDWMLSFLSHLHPHLHFMGGQLWSENSSPWVIINTGSETTIGGTTWT